MSALWHELLANLAVVALFVFLWLNIRYWIPQQRKAARDCAFGLLMAAGAITLLQMPFELHPGFYADLRSSPVALAGFFGGPIAGLICGAFAAVYRAEMGGGGALSGCLGIAMAMLSGIAGNWFLRGKSVRRTDILLLATAVGPGLTLVLMALPLQSWATVDPVSAIPIAALSFVATLVSGLAIHQDDGRREVLRANLMYRTIFEALPDSLNVKDLEGKFLAANPATARLMKARSADDLIGRTDFDFYPSEIAKTFRADEQKILRQGKNTEFAQQFAHADGAGGWLWTLKVPFRDENGQVLGLMTHNRDMTDWKHLQDEVAQSRQHLSMALTHMADALVMFDSDYRLVFCNEQYHALFPKTAHLRVPGARMQDLLRAAVEMGEASAPADTEQWIKDTCATYKMAGGQQIRLGDDRWLDARTRPIEDGGFLVVYSDITQTKRAEETLRELNSKLEASAKTDGLTGLANRRAFDEQLERDLAMSARTGRPLSLLLIDVDRFKAFNDTYGHLAGDECLRQIALCLKGILLRATDMAARYGGEELAAILPDTDNDGAFRVAEEFLASLRNLQIPHMASEKSVVTASIGVATIAAGGTLNQSNELIRRADVALYGAKSSGRDRVHGWRPRLESTTIQKTA